MKNLIKATLVLVILIVVFIKVYAPLMNEEGNRIYSSKNLNSSKDLSIKENGK